MSGETMVLSSPAFADGGFLPLAHTAEGADRSPELAWRGAPEEVESFVVLALDLDAPEGPVTHWLLFDVPRYVAHLSAGVSAMGIAGGNDLGGDGWAGPRADGRARRIAFRVLAIAKECLLLPPGATRAQVEEEIRGQVLASAELVARRPA
jgi:Raf kinase inhibitor-like YbhB/YbcL family protein